LPPSGTQPRREILINNILERAQNEGNEVKIDESKERKEIM
jgi:hypothetical protein